MVAANKMPEVRFLNLVPIKKQYDEYMAHRGRLVDKGTHYCKIIKEQLKFHLGLPDSDDEGEAEEAEEEEAEVAEEAEPEEEEEAAAKEPAAE